MRLLLLVHLEILENSEKARRYVENKIEHPIRIISGLEEAKLIRLHPKAQSGSNKVYVDVGGGSTELYIHRKWRAYNSVISTWSCQRNAWKGRS